MRELGFVRIGIVIGGAVAVAMTLAAGAAGSTVERDFDDVRIQGDNDTDEITLSSNGTLITVVDTGPGGATTADPDCNQVNLQTVTCPIELPGQPDVTGFNVDLNNGVDSFTNQNFVTEFGSVDSFGATGSKTILGGPGRQSLEGGLDSDTINGGDGDDFLYDGGGNSAAPTGGNDLLLGGPGEDSTQYFRTDAPITVTLDGQANDGRSGEADNVQVEHVAGTVLGDTLIGDAGANVLAGFGGGDVLLGQGGNDELIGDLSFGGGLALSRRGIAGPAGGDTLNGGAGRDGLDCGGSFDVALRDPDDDVRPNCERIGASVVGDSATVRGKRKRKSFKVRISCPESELNVCKGRLNATADGRKVGKGKFSVANGKVKRAKVKLSKRGRNALRKARGSLFVTVEARTNEPGGVAVDAGRVLVNG